jgi:hypothetical protein
MFKALRKWFNEMLVKAVLIDNPEDSKPQPFDWMKDPEQVKAWVEDNDCPIAPAVVRKHPRRRYDFDDAEE